MNETTKDIAADALLNSLFKSFPDAIVIVDCHGTLVSANDAFCRVTGSSMDEVLGAGLSGFCFIESGAEDKVEVALDSSVLRDSWDGQVIWKTRAGDKRSLLLTAVRLGESKKQTPGWALIAHPVGGSQGSPTGRQFQQQKLESLGVLASSIAHDLNNLLTAVLGHVSYLRLSDSGQASREESILAIEDGARRAAALTHQILDFARGEKVELATVNLSLIIAAAINLMRASLPESIRVKTKYGKEDIFIFGDETQLSQLVMNLLVNAKDAILPASGEIHLELKPVNIDSYRISGDFEVHPGKYVSLSIKDNGAGIPDPVRQRIFEPFFTTKQKSGTGIGLATVFSIVKAHRGCIELETQEGVGTSFEILLPLGEKNQTDVTFNKPEAVERGTERVLVVDDEETVRTVMQRSLEHLGYEVVVARDGVEAAQLFKDDTQGYDLIILDMIMPNMSGDELFYKLKEMGSTTPVLIASGYSSDVRTKAVLRDGARGFIQKPFAVEELAQEVRKCIDDKDGS